MANDELVELYRARGADEAHALRARLEDAGVMARVDGELLGGLVGEVPFGWVTAPRLLVRAADREAAESILAEFVRETVRSAAGRKSGGDGCLACGAEMGDTEICAACGWTFGTDSPNDSE